MSSRRSRPTVPINRSELDAWLAILGASLSDFRVKIWNRFRNSTQASDYSVNKRSDIFRSLWNNFTTRSRLPDYAFEWFVETIEGLAELSTNVKHSKGVRRSLLGALEKYTDTPVEVDRRMKAFLQCESVIQLQLEADKIATSVGNWSIEVSERWLADGGADALNVPYYSDAMLGQSQHLLIGVVDPLIRRMWKAGNFKACVLLIPAYLSLSYRYGRLSLCVEGLEEMFLRARELANKSCVGVRESDYMKLSYALSDYGHLMSPIEDATREVGRLRDFVRETGNGLGCSAEVACYHCSACASCRVANYDDASDWLDCADRQMSRIPPGSMRSTERALRNGYIHTIRGKVFSARGEAVEATMQWHLALSAFLESAVTPISGPHWLAIAYVQYRLAMQLNENGDVSGARLLSYHALHHLHACRYTYCCEWHCRHHNPWPFLQLCRSCCRRDSRGCCMSL